MQIYPLRWLQTLFMAFGVNILNDIIVFICNYWIDNYTYWRVLTIVIEDGLLPYMWAVKQVLSIFVTIVLAAKRKQQNTIHQICS